MTSSTARKANVMAFSQSTMLLLLLLLLHLFISVCHGRSAAPSRDGDITSPLRSDDNEAEPNVFAVFERRDHISGKITTSIIFRQ